MRFIPLFRVTSGGQILKSSRFPHDVNRQNTDSINDIVHLCTSHLEPWPPATGNSID